MTEANVSFAGNLTDDPEVRYTENGIAQAMFRVAVSGRREQEASFFTVIVWRDQAEHAAESPGQGQPGRGRGPTRAAELDRRGWRHPIGRGGRGRRAGAKPALGDGDHDQDHAQSGSVASSTSDATGGRG
jgi:hypothetical protein